MSKKSISTKSDIDILNSSDLLTDSSFGTPNITPAKKGKVKDKGKGKSIVGKGKSIVDKWKSIVGNNVSCNFSMDTSTDSQHNPSTEKPQLTVNRIFSAKQLGKLLKALMACVRSQKLSLCNRPS